MDDNAYLYGKEVEVPEIPADIIMRRVELLNDTLTDLLSEPLLERDTLKINRVLKAITFWETINDTY